MSYTLKKSLGQHFLHDEHICRQIVDFLNPGTTHLLEIGPGAGALSKYLVAKPLTDYRCIEIDLEKIDYLHRHFPALKGKIIHDDFLNASIPFDGQFSIIGNFPYNISTQIIFHILDWREQVDEVIGMFQKEVAQRIASKHGSKDYGILSVLTQCYYEVDYLLDVAPACFTPPPKVDSGVIRLLKRDQALFAGDYKKFKQFIKAAFAQRRKTLRNCLKALLPADRLQDDLFNKRAEQLSVEDFVALYHRLFP